MIQWWIVYFCILRKIIKDVSMSRLVHPQHALTYIHMHIQHETMKILRTEKVLYNDECLNFLTGHLLASLSSVTPFSASSKNILALLIWLFMKFLHLSVTLLANMSLSESPAWANSSCGRYTLPLLALLKIEHVIRKVKPKWNAGSFLKSPSEKKSTWCFQFIRIPISKWNITQYTLQDHLHISLKHILNFIFIFQLPISSLLAT